MNHDIDDVIVRLEAASIPSRRVDGMIAQIMGWRLSTQDVFEAGQTEPKRRQVWLLPDKDAVARVPAYTANYDAAYALARDIAPKAKVGVSWETGIGNAKIGDGPYVHSVSGPIALCIASLMALKVKKASEGSHGN